MEETQYSGRRFRTLNILDEGMREGLAIEIDTSLPGEHVVRVLDQLKAGPCRTLSVATTARSS